MWHLHGNERAVKLVSAALAGGSLGHAYLLVGPPGVGKMRLALDMARAVNCEGGQPPCDDCEPCRRIEAGQHPDIRVIELGVNEKDETRLRTKIGVDQIDDILHQANLPPFNGRCKVFIIDEAELLSVGAANRLLKILEEPPARVIFILLAVRDDLLPATVISRCQCLELQPVPVGQIETWLRNEYNIEESRAALLARLSHGCPGWARRALADEESVAGRNFEMARLLALGEADYETRFAYAGELATGFRKDRRPVWKVLSFWQDWWRDLMLVNTGCPEAVINIDYREKSAEIAANYSLEQIKGYLKVLADCRLALSQNVNPRLALELLMMEIPEVKCA
jgi:DNA polymerase III subunit delta'